MEPGRRRDHSGCVEGDGGVGGEGGEGPGIIAAMQTEKQKKCGGVKGGTITSVDPTLFQIEYSHLRRFMVVLAI